MPYVFLWGMGLLQGAWMHRAVPPGQEARRLDADVSGFLCLSLTLNPVEPCMSQLMMQRELFSDFTRQCLFSTEVTIMPAINQREPNLSSEPWEPEVVLLLMSFYFYFTLGKNVF